MNILVVIHGELDQDEQARVQNRLNPVRVMVETNYSVVSQKLKTSRYMFVVFITFGEAFPGSWNLHDDSIQCPTLLILKVQTKDLMVLASCIQSMAYYWSNGRSLPETEPELSPLLVKSLTFIDENLNENELCLEMVASHVFVSRCHFSRLFKEHFGQGFKEYVMQKRIDLAKTMLQEGHPVTEVCYAVGYGDLTHFGRVFRKLVGENPSVFRRRFVNAG